MNETDSIDFIAGILENNKVKYIELSTRKVMGHIYNLIDEDGEYFYCLFKYKNIRKGKRKKKDIKNYGKK